MKTFLSVTALCSLTLMTASADWVMESKVENPQMNSTIMTKIKGDRMRMDIATGPMGAMSTILDAVSGDSVQLVHAQKMAMKISGSQMKQQIEIMKKNSGLDANTKSEAPKATGEKVKVGEWDGEIYTWSDGKNQARFWVASNIPHGAELKALSAKVKAGAMGGAQAGPDETALPGIVVKSEAVAMGVTTTMTVTSIKEQAVDAATFDTPKDYNSIGVPSMGGDAPSPKSK
jgi:Domain of unknown function (DUF4412)